MKEIPLTQGKVALVDDADYPELSKYKWCAQHTEARWYAIRFDVGRMGRCRIPMHRAILNAPSGLEVDHRNHNGLDNRRANLRLATKAENQRNRNKPATNTSGYKGVSWHKGHNRWQAQIRHDGRARFLGYFDTPEQAARAYDSAAIETFGEFALPNFGQ